MPKKLSIIDININLEVLNIVCIEYSPKKSKFICTICNKDFSGRYQDVLKKKTRTCACGRNKLLYKLELMIKNKEKIGMLTPIKYLGRTNMGRMTWKFKCDCGKLLNITSIDILRKDGRGYTSCGCNKGKFQNRHSSWTGHKELSGTHWGRITSGAKSRNLILDIDQEYVYNLYLKQNKKCKLSGRDISLGTKYTASLDRIDSLRGYTKDNVQWIHRDINKMKMEFSQEYFIKTCKEISEYCNVK